MPEPKFSSFIFLCDLATEQECLDRRLFGTNPGEAHTLHYSKVAPGDRLFLYNLEVGTLRGPFSATTSCQANIEPTAWKKTKRRFPWQVRVDDAAVMAVPLTADDLARCVPLASTRVGLLPPPELDDLQADKVLVAMRSKNPAK